MPVEIKKLPKSQIEISASLAPEAISSWRAMALEKLGQNLSIDGFRPGKIPEKILVEKIGEAELWREMAELAISDYFPKLIEEHQLEIIGRPELSITKLAPGNPLEFKVIASIFPEISLANYHQIAKEINRPNEPEPQVNDEEVNQTLEQLRQRQTNKNQSGLLGPDGQNITPSLPELNDEFARSLGQFADLNELKNKLKESLLSEKIHKQKEKRRLSLVDAIIKQSTIDLPEVLIEAETEKMLSEMKYQIESLGLKFDEYLTHLKKTEIELRQDWRSDANHRVNFGLVVNAIAEQEKIKADKTELDKELAHLQQHYPKVEPDRLLTYANNLIVNEKTLSFLETIKD